MNQDTRLDHRIIDVRVGELHTWYKQLMLCVYCTVCVEGTTGAWSHTY